MAKKIIVIGGGPGGYVAAIRAAQLGAQVTLIERDALGGTCLNRGCVPTKALLYTAELLSKIRTVDTFGIIVEKASLDFAAVMKRKEAAVKKQVDGISYLMRKNKIKVIKGTGTLVDSKTLRISENNEKVSADTIIVATGSKPSTVPIQGINDPGVINSDQALSMSQLPSSIAIIGGGVIGLEFAQIMSNMDCSVTIVEMMPQILPAEDAEIANMLEEKVRENGIRVFTSATATNITSDKQGKKVLMFTAKDSSKQKLVVDKVLLAVGRIPYTDNLNIDKLGLAVDKGSLIVNEYMETNVTGIYAIGDVVGGPMLAHKAMEEGRCAAENCLGNSMRVKSRVDYHLIPRCVYTFPEVASVGLTESEAREKFDNIQVGRFPFTASSRARIANETTGIVKIISDAKYGEIVGIHIIGPQATELIAEAVLAIKLEATVEDIASTIHAHPTLSEAIMEAALSIGGNAIHL